LTAARRATNERTCFSAAGCFAERPICNPPFIANRPGEQQHVAKPDLGSKRQCQNCGAKFFDLNRDPILCPKCGSVFQVVAATRAPARAAVADDEATPDAAAELVPLEDADASDSKAVAAVEDDIEIEDDDTADETFLAEEEEEDDDVTGLIDGDIEDDEES
jgi:uncharacterized protein (TIGR02300 family)